MSVVERRGGATGARGGGGKLALVQAGNQKIEDEKDIRANIAGDSQSEMVDVEKCASVERVKVVKVVKAV